LWPIDPCLKLLRKQTIVCDQQRAQVGLAGSGRPGLTKRTLAIAHDSLIGGVMAGDGQLAPINRRPQHALDGTPGATIWGLIRLLCDPTRSSSSRAIVVQLN
jgi:hypothetical protein